MKIRTGFVSNSSSSSFIITIGEVTDNDAITSCVDEMKLQNEDDYFFLNKDKYEEMCKGWYHPWDCDWAGYDGSYTIERFFDKNPDGVLFIKTGIGPSDDYFFRDEDDEDDEFGEINYDNIEVDDFEEEDQKFYNGGVKGIRVIDSFYGAGRNG